MGCELAPGERSLPIYDESCIQKRIADFMTGQGRSGSAAAASDIPADPLDVRLDKPSGRAYNYYR